MDKIKVLYVESNTDGTIGGSYFSLYYLVSNLDRNIYTPHILFYTDNIFVKKYEKLGIKVTVYKQKPYLNLVKNFGKNLGAFKKIILFYQKLHNSFRFYIVNTIKYYLFLKKNDIKIVHLNNAVLGNHAWIMAAKLGGLKCIVHQRGILDCVDKMMQILSKTVDIIICISKAVEESLPRLGLNPKRIKTVYNAIDFNTFIEKKLPEKLYSNYGLSPRDTVIGLIGNIKKWKGQEVLVDAIHILNTRNIKLKCLLIGGVPEETDTYFKNLKFKVKELGLSDQIFFTGFVRNIQDFYKILKIVVHASIEPEPFGRVIIEAMAFKKPVIATKMGGPKEIIKNLENGVLIEPANPIALANAIEKVLTDDEFRKKISINGYNMVLKEFNIKNHVNIIQDIYRQI